MEYRRLGQTDLHASAIGFGCNRIAQASSTGERRAVVSTLEQALDCGINFFDTADSYDHGASERLLGSVFRSQRDRVILCSKGGYRSWPVLMLDRWLPAGLLHRVRPPRLASRGRGTDRTRRHSFTPRFISMAIEGSLRRLGTDHLDVFYLHSPPAGALGDDALFEILARLRQKGWIRYYGISCAEGATTEFVLAAVQQPGISVLQMMVNPLASVDLKRILPRAAELGVAVVGRQPFHRGTAFGSQPLAGMLSEHKERTPAQTLLRSVLQLRGVDVALVGMRSSGHLAENIAALSGPPLSADDMERLYAGTRTR